ncbi:hypothetical protein E7T06_03700 [Deinococcus sp. Arct2-2]|uniref:hypothetical protein n=1 Tax=Deinococcus sp. Arct2-2 TaxID=2568653 RepID=UPI0010A35154|nr:hypothetical protein [Deinococcus sp. Arct2-2]THF71190.1 hypothetical protein E7T06_03700 [Deinococcus sp. Arct2-2]
MTQNDDRNDALPVNPVLSVRGPDQTEHISAEQGDAPADVAQRPIPPMLTPSTEGLSAGEVSTMLGGDASMTEANEALGTAEGLDTITES